MVHKNQVLRPHYCVQYPVLVSTPHQPGPASGQVPTEKQGVRPSTVPLSRGLWNSSLCQAWCKRARLFLQVLFCMLISRHAWLLLHIYDKYVIHWGIIIYSAFQFHHSSQKFRIIILMCCNFICILLCNLQQSSCSKFFLSRIYYWDSQWNRKGTWVLKQACLDGKHRI